MANAIFDGDPKSLHSFAEFYPFYLNEHNNVTCRKLHFIGSTLALICLWSLIWTGRPVFIAAGLRARDAFLPALPATLDAL